MTRTRPTTRAALVLLGAITTACSSDTTANNTPAASATITAPATAASTGTSTGDRTTTSPANPPTSTPSPVPSAPTLEPTAHGQPMFAADPACGTYSGDGCAATNERIDIERPVFTHPTEITNPLFPISRLSSVVFLGSVDGKPFRSETTLLPGHATVVVGGTLVEVVLSQYLAYLDGRITEVAVDRYAQADDGSVWYLGEDVYDYDNGAITVTEGTWLAGRDGPPAMIMPGDPQVGQVFRSEDIPGIVFEEITIKQVDQTVDGPLGPVPGAVIAEELHLDGETSEKTFAPGYGEFYTANASEVEAMATAADTEASDQPEPIALAQAVSGTWGLIESARLEDWEAVGATLDRVAQSWAEVSKEPTPTPIANALDTALSALRDAVATQQVAAVANAAVDVAQSALDLELRYRTAAYVDTGRFHLHTQQLRIDAAADDATGVAAELATLEWIRQRITATLTPDELHHIDDRLAVLRATVAAGDLSSTADQAARVANVVRDLPG